MGIVKVTMKRSELGARVDSANRRRTVVGSERISMKGKKAYQVAPAPVADE